MKLSKSVVKIVIVLCFGIGIYGANPNYSYLVDIADGQHGNFQQKSETRVGENAQGFYSVLEPNGLLRTVKYTSDERGFLPVVTYSQPGAETNPSQNHVQIHDKRQFIKNPQVQLASISSNQKIIANQQPNLFFESAKLVQTPPQVIQETKIETPIIPQPQIGAVNFFESTKLVEQQPQVVENVQTFEQKVENVKIETPVVEPQIQHVKYEAPEIVYEKPTIVQEYQPNFFRGFNYQNFYNVPQYQGYGGFQPQNIRIEKFTAADAIFPRQPLVQEIKNVEVKPVVTVNNSEKVEAPGYTYLPPKNKVTAFTPTQLKVINKNVKFAQKLPEVFLTTPKLEQKTVFKTIAPQLQPPQFLAQNFVQPTKFLIQPPQPQQIFVNRYAQPQQTNYYVQNNVPIREFEKLNVNHINYAPSQPFFSKQQIFVNEPRKVIQPQLQYQNVQYQTIGQNIPQSLNYAPISNNFQHFNVQKSPQLLNKGVNFLNYAPGDKEINILQNSAVTKNNPLTFNYGYDNGVSKVTHSYFGSGW